MQGGRLAAVLALTATLLVLQDTHGFVDLYRAYGSWNSYSTCDMFQAAEPDPSGSAHEATCAVKLLIVTNGTILGQTVACDGETATVHGKDFLYMELAQQGAVVTRLPGVHRAGGVYTFPGWRMVRPRCQTAREQQVGSIFEGLPPANVTRLPRRSGVPIQQLVATMSNAATQLYWAHAVAIVLVCLCASALLRCACTENCVWFVRLRAPKLFYSLTPLTGHCRRL